MAKQKKEREHRDLQDMLHAPQTIMKTFDQIQVCLSPCVCVCVCVCLCMRVCFLCPIANSICQRYSRTELTPQQLAARASYSLGVSNPIVDLKVRPCVCVCLSVCLSL